MLYDTETLSIDETKALERIGKEIIFGTRSTLHINMFIAEREFYYSVFDDNVVCMKCVCHVPTIFQCNAIWEIFKLK